MLKKQYSWEVLHDLIGKNRCNKARLLVISDRYITRMTRLVPCEVLEQPSQVEHAVIFVCWSTTTSQVD